MRCALQILTLLSLSLSPARAQQLPPPTPAEAVVDTFFGTPLADPYRWLEDLESPAVRAWFRAQGAYARAALDALPGHTALLERFRQIDAAAVPDVSLPREAGGRWFYTMRPPAESVARGYVRELRTGEERLLVDPTVVPGSGGEAGSRLATFLPSPDGRLVLYGVMTGGTEEVVLRVRDVGTGHDVEGPIERNQWDELAFWDPGGRVFFYAQIRDPGTAPASERFVGIRLVRHRLGTDPDSDVAVLSAAALDEEPGLFPWVDLDPRSAVALGRLVGAGGYSAYYTTSAAAVASGTPEWQPLFPISDSILAVVPHETDLYVLTRRGAGSVLRTPLDAPDLHTADTVLTADERTTLQNMSAAGDGLYVQLFSEGVTRLTRIPWGGSPQPVELPSGTSIASDGFDNEVRTDPLRDGALLTLDSWTAASTHYRYDPTTDRVQTLALHSRGATDRLDGYLAESVYAPSHDGVLVPLTIVRPERLDRDGSLAVILEGYGAYGATDFRRYEPGPWWDAGGAWATCHVRGGGYYGDAWHRAGRQADKPNSWLDFIACAEYLVREGYTRPQRLVAAGGSAGGITVGRAITERPELFAAAIISNGVLDAVRNETTAVGALNIDEFGSTASQEGFHNLLAMSPYHHVRPGTRYPAVLLEIGLDDVRVGPWQSAKLAAALQSATSSGRPVLLRVEAAGGHISGDIPAERRRLLHADNLAFWMAAAGVPFPPARPGGGN